MRFSNLSEGHMCPLSSSMWIPLNLIHILKSLNDQFIIIVIEHISQYKTLDNHSSMHHLFNCATYFCHFITKNALSMIVVATSKIIAKQTYT